MEKNYQYIVEEYSYGSTNANKIFSEKINSMGEKGYRLISSQLKPFKNPASNNYDMICIYEKISNYGQ